MRTTTLVRTASRTLLVGATAASLTLGAGLASADTSSSADAARKQVTQIRANNPVIRDAKGKNLVVKLVGTSPYAGTTSIKVDLKKGNTVLAQVPIDTATNKGTIPYDLAYGRGVRTVGPIYYYDAANQLIGTQGLFDTLKARSGAAAGSGYTLRKRNGVVKFKTTFNIWSFKSNKAVSGKRLKLQVRRNGTWRTLKNVKLDKNGKGSYTFRSSSVRKYRVKVKSTDKVKGTNTDGIRV